MKNFEALDDSMLENVVGGVTDADSTQHYYEMLDILKKEHNDHIRKGLSLAVYARTMNVYVNNALENGYINDFHYGALINWVQALSSETDYVY